jgi:hypothetical protein
VPGRENISQVNFPPFPAVSVFQSRNDEGGSSPPLFDL